MTFGEIMFRAGATVVTVLVVIAILSTLQECATIFKKVREVDVALRLERKRIVIQTTNSVAEYTYTFNFTFEERTPISVSVSKSIYEEAELGESFRVKIRTYEKSGELLSATITEKLAHDKDL